MVNLLAMVQEAAQPIGGSGDIGAGIAIVGAGLVVIGAGLGIGKIGSRMTESMARQPEAAAQIQTAAIILAALIEGVALFGLVIAGFIK